MKTKLRHILLIIALFVIHARLDASSPESKYAEANKLYTNGDYASALQIYKQIADGGNISSDVYYNLANSYYRLKKVPDAILYFERAKLLAPDDEDIEFNLKVANLRVVDKIHVLPKFFLTEWFESIRDMNSSSSWAMLTIVLSWLTFIALALFLMLWSPAQRKLFFAAACLFIIANIISFIFAYQTYKIETSSHYAIIFAPSVFVKSSPDAGSTKLVTLHEGTKVQLLDSVGDWRKIKIADGNIGWLEAETMVKI